MVIKINNKKYNVVFNYKFVKFVMAKNGWVKFSEYDQFIQRFAFSENDFGPEHLELFAELVTLGISAGLGEDTELTIEEVVNLFWVDMSLLQKVVDFFAACQPKTPDVVDPASRLGK